MTGTEGNIRLEPQVASLLTYFLANQERLISRSELVEKVWSGRVISDDAINRCISILRQALSPTDTHTYIETIRRRGYLAHFPPPPATPEATPQQRHTRPFLLVALAVILLLAVYLNFRDDGAQDQPPIAPTHNEPPVVAVLPFSAIGPGEDSAFFADGMHDDLLTQLARMQALRVISRTSVMPYQDTERNLRNIGRELGADAILEGSVQQVGDSLRINVQLIDAATDEHLWAQRYDRELSARGIFSVQSEIAEAVAGAMRATLSLQDSRQLAILPTQNMAAYRAYHQAMGVRSGTGVSDPAYARTLEQAVSLDPSFVRAWSELAGVLSFQYFGDPREELVQQVERIIEVIREHAPDSAEHLIAQTYYTYYILQDNALAHQLISRAYDLRPGDAELLELKSWIERRLGDHAARLESLRLASKLDPLNPERIRNLVMGLIVVHDYDQAWLQASSLSVADYNLEVLQSMLAVREHGDFGRWADEVRALQREFGRGADKLDLFEALVADRNYQELNTIWLTDPESAGARFGLLVWGDLAWELHQLFALWLLQDDHGLAQAVQDARDVLQHQGGFGPELYSLEFLLLELVISAVSGSSKETEWLYRRWEREASEDEAHLINDRHLACRALAMAAAGPAAVRCLREALRMPSFVMPFIDPLMPYYDPVREQPEFQTFLAELNSTN